MIALYLLFCISGAAFFGGMETGLISANRMLLQEKKEKGLLYARSAEYLLSKPERLLGTTLIGYNVANVTAAVLFTNFLVSIGWERYIWLCMLGLTFVLLIFNDLVPKSFLRRHADALAVKLSPLLLVFYAVFLPLYLVLNGVVKAVLYISGHHVSRREELKSKRDVRFLINLVSKEVGLPQPDMQIIEDIFDFRDQAAHEVMIPFHQLTAVPVHWELRQGARLSHESGQRFLPVYRGRIDNVVGYVDSLGLVFQKEISLQEVMKKAVFYPEILRIPDLLLEMNRKGLDVVFLADEYGGFSGMITPGQIVGELVHYIPEEGSLAEEITKLGPGHFRMAGRTDLEDVIRETGISLKRGTNGTIGGYICEKLGIIPDLGTVYSESGYLFTVTKRDDRHIAELEVSREG